MIYFFMKNIDFEFVESDYEKTKLDFQNKNNNILAKNIANEIKEHKEILKDVFEFLIEVFSGKLRNDNKTPMVFHSVYLTKILYLCGEKNINTLITGALHDVLEDTSITENELKNKSFLKGKEYLIDYLKILKEDKSLSREPDGKNLPPRYKEHIKRIINAPKEVINTEIIDRFSDLDIDYLFDLPKERKNFRIISKIIKTKGYVENITRNRNDINKICLDLFNYKVNKVQKLYNIEVNVPVLS